VSCHDRTETVHDDIRPPVFWTHVRHSQSHVLVVFERKRNRHSIYHSIVSVFLHVAVVGSTCV
jgi:hypothetical protein